MWFRLGLLWIGVLGFVSSCQEPVSRQSVHDDRAELLFSKAAQMDVDALRDAVRANDVGSVAAAMELLRRGGAATARLGDLVDSLDDKRRDRFYGKVWGAPELIEAAKGVLLEHGLRESNTFIAGWARSALVSMGPRIQPELLAILGSEDDPQSFHAAVALTQIDEVTHDVIKVIAESLLSTNRGIQWGAINHLARLAECAESAVPALVERLSDESWGRADPELTRSRDPRELSLRVFIPETLLTIAPNDSRVAEALVRAVEDSNPCVGLEAIYKLSHFGAAAGAASPTLRSLIKEASSAGPDSKPQPASDWSCESKLGEAAIGALAAVSADDPETVNSLILALRASDAGLRRSAASALASLGSKSAPATGVLVAFLFEGSRDDAARALGRIGEPAIEPLVRLARDGEIPVDPAPRSEATQDEFSLTYAREGALRAIRQLDASLAGRVLPTLRELLEDPERGVRRSAQVAYRRFAGHPITRTHIPYFCRLLQERKGDQRWFAASILGDMGPEAREAIPDLLRVLSGEGKGGRPTAAASLGRLVRGEE
ncbi:MAG: hypothetical protein AAF517_25525, partial [Planctomycetota bacterium]